ncbi:hypothetical protein M413DRAFT_31928 [Hebeloma cylindrosporum]|uniref:Fungal mating-type pheromone n=1 Tax=Hebeloma cylindrosporum TaxID=76867 RepID=A0A0C3BHJ3_HEBCY|nr:hypothetical protein M413DRAFT_31928 [Hebeloma cylindrosporum h7]
MFVPSPRHSRPVIFRRETHTNYPSSQPPHSHPHKMDAFAAITAFFTTVEDVSVPSNDETGGSGGNAYCVVA